MRISDWSSDVCSSDLASLSNRPYSAPANRVAPIGAADEDASAARGSFLSYNASISVAETRCPGVSNDPMTPPRNAPDKRILYAYSVPHYRTEEKGVMTVFRDRVRSGEAVVGTRSEEHTYELQSLMRISYAVFCLKT